MVDQKTAARCGPISVEISVRWVLGGLKTNVFPSRTLSESFFLPMTYNDVVILKVTARLSPWQTLATFEDPEPSHLLSTGLVLVGI